MSTNPTRTKCRSCPAPIVWARTAATGAMIPLNADPDPDGNVRLDSSGVATTLGAGSLDLFAAQAAGEVLYMPHHATCPHAGDWRRR